GGALVNLAGQLVGINTASFNPQGSMAGNIGLGLAIPSNLARDVVEQLITKGVVVRGTLGVETQNLSPQIAQGLGLAEARGALVTRVLAGSAAAAAGLRAGDVVTAINGQRVDNAQALHNFEGLQPVGRVVELDVRRDGKPLQLKATLKEQPRAVTGDTLDPRLSGATFVDLPESARQSGLNGVLVSEVARGSRAAQSGLAGGDIVLAASSGEFVDLASWRASFSPRPPQLVLSIVRGNTQGQLVMR
ncbi:PDZ domain-containing protein, partial [Stenotrophomonas acidaminiphila]